MARQQRTVIRVIVMGNQHGDWFGHAHDRHNVGELLQVLEHATQSVYLHRLTGDKTEKLIFDIFPPAHCKTSQDQAVWAQMEAERMQSFGYNAVPAPEWKDI